MSRVHLKKAGEERIWDKYVAVFFACLPETVTTSLQNFVRYVSTLIWLHDTSMWFRSFIDRLFMSLIGFSFLRNCGDRPWEVESKNLISNKLQVSNWNHAKDDLSLSLSSDSLWWRAKASFTLASFPSQVPLSWKTCWLYTLVHTSSSWQVFPWQVFLDKFSLTSALNWQVIYTSKYRPWQVFPWQVSLFKN